MGLARSKERAIEVPIGGAAHAPFETESVSKYVEPSPLWARPPVERDS
jgi:hypothetical protein